jgi:uridine kinase
LFEPTPDILSAADRICSAVRQLGTTLHRPVLVALDGGSGSGKSALAALIAERLDAIIISGDDFYAANIPDAEWERRTPAERAADVIDWRRLRAHALEPLLAGERAVWYSFDFTNGPRRDGTYRMCDRPEVREPSSVIILDGAYSARPELDDLVDLSVLVDVPAGVRHQRLAEREAPDFLAAWHQRWDEAEAWYLTHVCPASAFDLVVTNM